MREKERRGNESGRKRNKVTRRERKEVRNGSRKCER